MAITLQTTKYNVIYVYRRTSLPDMVKIGKTNVDSYSVEELTPNCEKLIEAVKLRLHDAITMGVNDIEILHAEVGYFVNSEGASCAFDDHAVHDVLTHSNYKKAEIKSELGIADEWFCVDLETAQNAITAVKNEQEAIDGPKLEKAEHEPIVFRSEQNSAINLAFDHFKIRGAKMLWNAKMRFGKTLCALELINKLDVKKTLILTHRPTVRSGWYEDYHLIHFKSNFLYGSKNGQSYNQCNSWVEEENGKSVIKYDTVGKDLKSLQSEQKTNDAHYIYFASMQDLRGKEPSKKGKKESDEEKKWKANNKLVFNTKWDLIIYDEAHEGTQTELGKEVISKLKEKNKPFELYLSGTPFNILPQFDEDEIYTWDYLMEQEAKDNWEKEHPGEPNPYEGLAKLNIYTYNLGEVYNMNPDYVKNDDDYFNFAEFFRTWTGNEEKDSAKMLPNDVVGHFVHENEVVNFLDLLCREEPESFYPYSNDNFRNALDHTLWMLPSVASADRLLYLLTEHPLHTKFGFEIISVAGEGEVINRENDAVKIYTKEKDALKKVKTAIKEFKRTITLSCGRLTTGVSVPEWTGVFMLCGGYSTGAANYMQTIFRGQTPYKDGRIKSNCYAFDFAPDRTLTVVNDYIKQQPKNTNGGTRVIRDDEGVIKAYIEDRHLPVIAMVGGVEKPYNTIEFITKVNEANGIHAYNHGFTGKKMLKNHGTYSVKDKALLKALTTLLSHPSSTKTNADGTLVISNSGLVGGSKTKTKKPGKNKPKSNKPKSNKSKEEAKENKAFQDTIDFILARFPLLLFGAVEDPSHLTMDEFLSDDVIDQESWDVFMPKGLTKTIFRQFSELISFEMFLTGATIVVNKAKEADLLPVSIRVVEIAKMLSKFHFPDKETVLTPWNVVNMHLVDTIGGYNFYKDSNEKIFLNPEYKEKDGITSKVFNKDSRILELNSKSGIYPLWLTYNIWRTICPNESSDEEQASYWKDVVETNIYVVCMSPMAKKITERVLAGYKKDIHVNACCDLEISKILKENKEDKIQDLIKKIKNPSTYNKTETELMKFNAIVSNPPYNANDGGNKNSSTPIYNHFVNLAKLMEPDYFTMIMPSRWLIGSKVPVQFRMDMMDDKHISEIYDFLDYRKVFPKAQIAGGVCYLLWDKSYRGNCNFVNKDKSKDDLHYNVNRSLDVFKEQKVIVRDNRAISIIKYIQDLKINDNKTLSEVISPRKPFGLNGDYKSQDSGVPCWFKQSIGYGFAESNKIDDTNKYMGMYKLLIPRSPIAGQTNFADRIGFYYDGNVITAQKGDVCTETYIVAFASNDKNEVESFKTYLFTKIVRFCLLQSVVSQDVTRECFCFVPALNKYEGVYTDERLKQEWNISDEDWLYIDSRIKSTDEMAVNYKKKDDATEQEVKIEIHNHIEHTDNIDLHGNIEGDVLTDNATKIVKE